MLQWPLSCLKGTFFIRSAHFVELKLNFTREKQNNMFPHVLEDLAEATAIVEEHAANAKSVGSAGAAI